MSDQTHDFIHELFGSKPDRAAVQIWHRSAPALTYIYNDLQNVYAAAVRDADKYDVYVACGLAPQGRERPQRSRLKAVEVCGIPGVWADIDINGGPDDKQGAAPDIEAAQELASGLLEPTLLVGSGYGLQAWWLLEDGPWMFPGRPDQDQAKRVVAGFQGALRAAARRAGYGLDSTQDLSRVMRIPGTFNHKGSEPVPVVLMELGGKRYAIEELAELGQGFAIAQDEGDGIETGDALTLQVRHGVQLDSRLSDLMTEEPEFQSVWTMKKGVGSKRRNWSASEFELSITNWLVRAGLDAQQICDVLVHWRGINEPGDPRGKNRPERLAKTIGKVMSTVAVEDQVEFVQSNREEAIKTMENMSHAPSPPSEGKVITNFNRIVEGPEIARLRQYSRDPRKARFSMELADGRLIELGPFDNIMVQSRFRSAYGIVTGHLPPSIGQKKWEQVVAVLLKAAVVVDDIEDSRAGQMENWIGEYLEGNASDDKDGACMSQGPFFEEGCSNIALGHFLRYLRRVVGERADDADVASALRTLGYERRTVAYRRPDGSRSTRSYFVGPPPGVALAGSGTPYMGPGDGV